MTKRDKTSEPRHGYCTLCKGRIEEGQKWTFTRQMNRVHFNPDRCIAVLHPRTVEKFLKANPHYREEFNAPEY